MDVSQKNYSQNLTIEGCETSPWCARGTTLPTLPQRFCHTFCLGLNLISPSSFGLHLKWQGFNKIKKEMTRLDAYETSFLSNCKNVKSSLFLKNWLSEIEEKLLSAFTKHFWRKKIFVKKILYSLITNRNRVATVWPDG